MALRIKNWHKFQHFKDRTPPWIKLYRNILDDREWHRLDPSAAKTLVMLWLIASESDGFVPDIETIAFRFRRSEQDVEREISMLSGWLEEADISAISERYLDDATEDIKTEQKSNHHEPSADIEMPLRDREETETEKNKPSRAARFDAQARLDSLGVSPNVVRDWIAIRKAKKAPVTETALDSIQREAEKAGLSLHDALKVCCERNWQGFKADWLTNQAGGRMNGHSDNSPFA